eukprot:CAMPEP_0113538494 /NCGR_PEP_ID=MMETSP0015_2-20120614/7394_1 /TAXON_ID=2838 /ORGANISM="Odontella" /LENGTH=524 /DNA_ID=CAMNT_0000438069 /DNA_START=45 /DNA_END=1619 /DNA_ORIENTATION=- /assembly_acc=CAM_ASM_000160
MATTTTSSSSSSSAANNPAKFVVRNADAVDLAKSTHPIATGVGFFDHMIDQFNSHAQVGVGATVVLLRRRSSEEAAAAAKEAESEEADLSDKNRLSEPPEDQSELMSEMGRALGTKFAALIDAEAMQPSSSAAEGDGAEGDGAVLVRSSRFCCPLDEALVECVLSVPAPSGSSASGAGELIEFTLPPYGIYPSPRGRTRIGRMCTSSLRAFFEELASSSGLIVSLKKVRGDNGHHVVESAFKAFSRALRNLLDGTDTGGGGSGSGNGDAAGGGPSFESVWGVESPSHSAGLELSRSAELSRSTRETSISVKLRLDGGGGCCADAAGGGISIETGVGPLDDFFATLAKEAGIGLNVECGGDTWVDDHHTSEDVAIAVGQCLNKALGTKAGLNRMWCAAGKSGDAEVEVTMDLSNRPCLTHDLSLSSNAGGGEYVVGPSSSSSSPPEAPSSSSSSPLSVEMFEHVLDSLVSQGQMTVHAVQRKEGSSVFETAMATAVAFGRALRMCAAVDVRRAGKTASSKGTLSV